MVGFGQGPIHVQSLVIRLVDEQQIDIVSLQPGQRFFNALPGQFIAGPGLTELRRNEDILPAQTALGHGLADHGFVIVHMGRIDEAVAHSQSIEDRPLPRFALQHPRPKTNYRHGQAIIQNDMLMHTTPPFILQNRLKKGTAHDTHFMLQSLSYLA